MNSKTMAQVAAMAALAATVPGFGDELAVKDPPAPKDPNSPKIAKAEAKRLRKAAKAKANEVKRLTGLGRFEEAAKLAAQ